MSSKNGLKSPETVPYHVAGARRTVKDVVWLLPPAGVTVMAVVPGASAEGMWTIIAVSIQVMRSAAFTFVPLNLTVPVPCTAPKPAPLIVSWDPGAPDEEDSVIGVGVGVATAAPGFLAVGFLAGVAGAGVAGAGVAGAGAAGLGAGTAGTVAAAAGVCAA